MRITCDYEQYTGFQFFVLYTIVLSKSNAFYRAVFSRKSHSTNKIVY